MRKTLQLLAVGAAFAFALVVAPTQASAKCEFSKKEKIAMVSWIVVIPGAVITGLGCKRDLFTKTGEKQSMLPAESRSHTDLRFIDRRKQRAI